MEERAFLFFQNRDDGICPVIARQDEPVIQQHTDGQAVLDAEDMEHRHDEAAGILRYHVGAGNYEPGAIDYAVCRKKDALRFSGRTRAVDHNAGIIRFHRLREQILHTVVLGKAGAKINAVPNVIDKLHFAVRLGKELLPELTEIRERRRFTDAVEGNIADRALIDNLRIFQVEILKDGNGPKLLNSEKCDQEIGRVGTDDADVRVFPDAAAAQIRRNDLRAAVDLLPCVDIISVSKKREVRGFRSAQSQQRLVGTVELVRSADRC